MAKNLRNAKERRNFLKGVAAASGAAALAAVSRQGVANETATPNQAEKSDSSEGYRETSHVKDYYASARI